MTIKIGVFGASGRMGQEIISVIRKNSSISLAGGTMRATKNHLVDFFVTDNPKELADKSDVLIDFTNPNALEGHLIASLDARKPIVVGTTGFSNDTKNFMQKIAGEIPVLQSGNMSLGVNLISKLVNQVSSILDQEWDIEVTETHHRMKIDSPSGTALMLGEAAAQGRRQDFKNIARLSREGIVGERPKGEIGFSTIRAGSVIGEHSVLFAHDDEMITVSHRAQNRKIFANGAVFAAQKIVNFKAGFYTMQDILPI